MSWYDTFAVFYDQSLEKTYLPYRSAAVSAMRLRPDDRVLNLACGTGQDFPHLQEAIGPNGHVIAVDFSSGMLARARERAERSKWANLTFIEKDARELTRADVGSVDAVLVSLGLSVIPDWRGVLEATFALLRPGGCYVIFDVYAKRWVPTSTIVSWVAQADLKRATWEPLRKLEPSTEHRWLEGSDHLYGGTPYLAIATRSESSSTPG